MAAEAGLLQAPPLGLYVHLPWCVRKCPYCDFNSHEALSTIPQQQYADVLIQDLEAEIPAVWGRTVHSVFFGGGTPSLFSAASIGHLLEQFRAMLPLAPAAEISLEANPGTIEHDSFKAYRAAGINRISLGAQSFDDDCLKRIGRIHGSGEIHQALSALHLADFENFNVDLMYGLPGQSVAQALNDVRLAIESGTPHVSHYQLTLEPNTLFAARPPRLPDSEQAWDMQLAAAELLQAAGFRQYEVSAWAKPGHECAHNLNYWRYGDFLGIGAGAHGKRTDVATAKLVRSSRHKHPARYLSGDFVAESRELAAADRIFEFFLNHLRLREPITPERFSARTGLAWSALDEPLHKAQAQGLLEMRAGQLQHTETGWRFVNDIQALFLP